MLRKIILIAAVALLCAPSSAKAAFGFGLNEQEVQEIVKDYIYNNPQVIIDSLKRMQVLEEQNRQRQARARVEQHRELLERDPATPVMGNPDGDVIIVEFFDYNCGYCKLMYKKVSEAVEKDGNMRWVLKDLPMLAESSETAALAGLAANEQGKYTEMHRELMNVQGGLDAKKINAAAKKIGLNMEKFGADMKKPEFKEHLQQNRQLAQELEIQGIPQFIIGEYVSQGAMMGDELEAAAQAVRFKNKTAGEPAAPASAQ